MKFTWPTRFLFYCLLSIITCILLFGHPSYPVIKYEAPDFLHTFIEINNTHYKLIKFIGKGEFGVTYVGDAGNSLPLLIIKILYLTPLQDFELRRRIQLYTNLNLYFIISQRESRELDALVIQGEFRGKGDINGCPYLAMQFHSGVHLLNLITTHQIKCSDEFMTIRETSKRLLSEIHQRDLAHADLKEANMMFEKVGQEFLIHPVDWGNAILKKEAGALKFFFARAFDYRRVEEMILEAESLFYLLHGSSYFWKTKTNFCVKSVERG